ncbi:MAG: TlyA family RNA methyltransferase [Phycisphaerae bacterium]|nr:TlyA family RNA methyltransferase [Phycisphaerae bacterium]
MKSPDPPHPYVSRGGLKLAHALESFGIDPRGLCCADLGCSTGGFTDCLLQRGAARVTAIDTSYGAFAWRLRNDPRVRLLERTNALHVAPLTGEAPLDLVVIDLGWTPQRLAIPAARRWVRGPTGRIVTLIKPHYELTPDEKATLLHRGVLEDADAERIVRRVLDAMPGIGARALEITPSPIRGSPDRSRGNLEWLALLEPS